MPTDTEKAYLAGLLDGEGHIGIMVAKQRAKGEWRTHSLIVTVANTHIATLRAMQTIWPGRLVIRSQACQRVPIGNLRWSSSSAAGVLMDVQPYLHIKPEQAALGLQFQAEIGLRDYRTKAITEAEWERREDLRLAISQINRPQNTYERIPFPLFRYKHTCIHCGQSFVLVGGNRRLYCSDTCYRQERRQRVKVKQAAT